MNKFNEIALHENKTNLNDSTRCQALCEKFIKRLREEEVDPFRK